MKAVEKKLTAIFGVALIIVMALSSTAYAITNGEPDGNAHPYVGWVVVWDGESPWVYLGTGSLIAPKVVLTAGHVVADEPDYIIEYVWVSFDPYAVWSPLSHPEEWNVAESWHTHPHYEIGLAPQLKN